MAGRVVPEDLHAIFQAAGDDWLMTREVPGVPFYHPSVGWPPSRVASVLGEILRTIHATDAVDCPFGTRKRGHVLVHGDFCLPNVLVTDGVLTGLIDVGQTGLGDPRQDLAAGVWSLQYNFGPGHGREFLDAYGAPSMTDQEIERLRRKYGR